MRNYVQSDLIYSFCICSVLLLCAVFTFTLIYVMIPLVPLIYITIHGLAETRICFVCLFCLCCRVRCVRLLFLHFLHCGLLSQGETVALQMHAAAFDKDSVLLWCTVTVLGYRFI